MAKRTRKASDILPVPDEPPLESLVDLETCTHCQQQAPRLWQILHEYQHLIKLVLCESCFGRRYQASPYGYHYPVKKGTNHESADRTQGPTPIAVGVARPAGTTQPSRWGGWRAANRKPSA